ncbi:spore germination lipoprotein GerD [Priestia taiwanensis]|uniref:Germination protein GerD n=1 Tax=Priestia taiwanensis TaxID=1347902 RepID=A0A917EU66_9BACI|nr:spore germination lipoprotein GerD [Priestia taiwanensis]MBM7365080.1 spore germination protein D [Priestia taiwanensis]GGE84429.1 germination protein GerD [Priestia taiwanensis]
MKRTIATLFLTCSVLTGCIGGNNNSQSEPNYDDTKKMVVDILKSDQAKKALTDLMKDEKMKEALVMDQAVIASSIENTLLSDKGKQFWEKTFKDPKFAASFGKSLQPQQEELMKSLMKDPEYQASMLEILKNPEIEKQTLDLLKSQQYRQHLQGIILETLNSPVFQAKMIDMISQASNDILSKQGGGEKKEGNKQEGGEKKEEEGEEGQ